MKDKLFRLPVRLIWDDCLVWTVLVYDHHRTPIEAGELRLYPFRDEKWVIRSGSRIVVARHSLVAAIARFTESVGRRYGLIPPADGEKGVGECSS